MVDLEKLEKTIVVIADAIDGLGKRFEEMDKKLLGLEEKYNIGLAERKSKIPVDTQAAEDIARSWGWIATGKTHFGPAKDINEYIERATKTAKFFSALVQGDHITLKQMAGGIDPSGGYLVPEEFRAEVIMKLTKLPVIRNRATVLPMGRERLNIPTETGDVAMYWEGENAQWTESSPSTGQLTLAVNRLNGLTKTSRELVADAAINLMEFLSRLYARKIGIAEDAAFMNGNGIGKPLGIRNTSGIGTVAQAGANLTGDDIIELYHTLGSQYRMNAVWIMHNNVIKLVRKLKDSQGQYIWTYGLGTAPDTILGRPVLEQNDIPINLGAGNNESEIYFCDLTYYYIGDRGEMGAETTTQGAGTFEKHQVAIKVWERIDGKVALTDAFKKLTGVK